MIPLSRDRHVVPTPAFQGSRGLHDALQHLELTGGEFTRNLMSRCGIGCPNVHRSPNGGAAIQGRIRPSDDFNGARIVDWQGDDARAVVGKGLWHAVHQQKRICKLGVTSRHSAQHDRVEDPELCAEDRARHMSDRLRKGLIAAHLDGGAVDDFERSWNVSDGNRRFCGCDLHSICKIRGLLELDANRGRLVRPHLHSGRPHVQKTARFDREGRVTRWHTVDSEPPTDARRGGVARAFDGDRRPGNRLSRITGDHGARDCPARRGLSLHHGGPHD
jgi:hypothetical protein